MMKIVRYFILIILVGVSFAAEAGQVTGISTKKITPKEQKLRLVTDFQWINDINKFEALQQRSSTQYGRMHVGLKYKFSEITEVSLDVPFGVLYSKTEFLGAQPVVSENYDMILDRTKLGIDAKLFRETIFGQISWSGKLYIPTLLGDVPTANRFYNHLDFSLGLKNLYRHPKVPLFVLGSFSFIKKFEAKYFDEEMTYGDEYAASLGVGYSVHSRIHPSVSFQYSYVGPAELRVLEKLTASTKVGAHAFHIVPMLSVPVTEKMSIQGISRIIVKRTKIDDKETSRKMWGNFEDEGDLSITLGARFKLL